MQLEILDQKIEDAQEGLHDLRLLIKMLLHKKHIAMLGSKKS